MLEVQPLQLGRLQAAAEALVAELVAIPGFADEVEALAPPPEVRGESFAWVRLVVDNGLVNAVDAVVQAAIAGYEDRLRTAADRLLFNASWGARVLHMAACGRPPVAVPTGGERSWVTSDRSYALVTVITEGQPVPLSHLLPLVDRLREMADELESMITRTGTTRIDDQRQEAWEVVDPEGKLRDVLGRPSVEQVQRSWDALVKNACETVRLRLAGEPVPPALRKSHARTRLMLNAAVTGVASNDVFASPTDAPDPASRRRERKRADLLAQGLWTQGDAPPGG